MSWKTKPSGTMQIDRRQEPYLTADMATRFTELILPRYATSMGALMPILHEIQHTHRHIPYQAMIEIAHCRSRCLPSRSPIAAKSPRRSH